MIEKPKSELQRFLSGAGALSAIIALLVIFLAVPDGYARAMRDRGQGGSGPLLKPAVGPNTQLRVHRISNVQFSITNKGIFGSQGQEEIDSLTGQPAESCEFPAGSNIDYLFQGCLWIGAVVERPNTTPTTYDTLVSIGNDGWWGDVYEMFPSAPPGGNILMLSTRGLPLADTVGKLLYDTGNREFKAVSEQDYIAIYYDTSSSTPVPDPNDGRDHRPLGLRIIQKSYAWSYEYAEDFILLDFEITNIGDQSLNDVWIALYVDGDVLHMSENPYGAEQGAQDDLCGFMQQYVSRNQLDTTDIYTAWIADNDGQTVGGLGAAFSELSPRGVSGVRVVRSPNPDLQYSFNWWISNTTSALDWGPMWQSNYNRLSSLFNAPVFPGGGLGTPGGDRAKYFQMSNHEFDYDQAYSALNNDGWQNQDWITNNAQDPAGLANGYDTRYLFSFGPFESIPAGSTLPLTIGYICGNYLHNNPANYNTNLRNGTGNRNMIDQYYANLNFRDFATNAQWAEWVYDNPGRDSCYIDSIGWVVDGNYGVAETTITGNDTTIFWKKGDGCPDFQGPPPPPSPRLEVQAGKGYMEIRWVGKNTEGAATSPGPEQFIDPFSGQVDFEGYGIYRSYDGINWTNILKLDRIDWVPVSWDSLQDTSGTWSYFWTTNKEKMFPISTDSVLILEPDAHFGVPSDPGITRYWIAHGYNTGLDQIIYDTTVVNNDTIFHYRYRAEGLSESRGVYYAVTSFDFGNPQTDLSPLESAKSINATLIYPIEKNDPIMVYPNPYKLPKVGNSLYEEYEIMDSPSWVEQSRKIYFSNLPDNQTAIFRIWTLDGDLVRVLTYDPRDYYGNPPGVIYWDLISRNTQAVVSGMYLYSVEFKSIADGVPDKPAEIGKFVIIK